MAEGATPVSSGFDREIFVSLKKVEELMRMIPTINPESTHAHAHIHIIKGGQGKKRWLQRHTWQGEEKVFYGTVLGDVL